MISRRSLLPVVCALALLAAADVQHAVAQNASDPARSPQASNASGPSRFISTNPFLPLFGYFSAEYEQRIKDNVAVAIAGSHLKLDARYTNLDAKIRLYPNDQALDGFSLAASLGVAWIRRDGRTDFCGELSCYETYKPFTTPSFAIEGGYQWLLGRTRSTAITAGFGAKRYLGGSRSDFRGVERVIPTGRLSIGYGF